MGRGSPVCQQIRETIIEMFKNNVPQRKIGRDLDISPSTVHNIIKRFKESGGISVRKGQGRKPKLNNRDLRSLRRHCIKNHHSSISDITTWAQDYFGKPLSSTTIRSYIHKCQLKLYCAKRKPYVNSVQKRRRLLWARRHLGWTITQWKHVLCTVYMYCGQMNQYSDAEKLVHAFMTSRLDYCNALLGGCPASSINKLQVVQNAAARVLTRSRKYDHITPILQSLHWLPIKYRISYKILLLTYKALNGLAPAYLTSLLSRYNPSRSLRSQNSGLLIVPRIAKSTKGGRAFSYLAPKLWNSLADNVQGSDTLSLFKSRLKTHLFSQAFT